MDASEGPPRTRRPYRWRPAALVLQSNRAPSNAFPMRSIGAYGDLAPEWAEKAGVSDRSITELLQEGFKCPKMLGQPPSGTVKRIAETELTGEK